MALCRPERLATPQDDCVRAQGDRMLGDLTDSCMGVHIRQFPEGVGIASRGCYQHGHAERRRLRR